MSLVREHAPGRKIRNIPSRFAQRGIRIIQISHKKRFRLVRHMLAISPLFILPLGTHIQSPLRPVFKTTLHPVIHRLGIVIRIIPIGNRVISPIRWSLARIILLRHQQRLVHRLRGRYMHEISFFILQTSPRTKPSPHTFNTRTIVFLPTEHRVHRQLECQVFRQPGVTRQIQQYTPLAILLQVTVLLIIRSRKSVIQLLRSAPQRHIVLLTHHTLKNILVQIIFPYPAVPQFDKLLFFSLVLPRGKILFIIPLVQHTVWSRHIPSPSGSPRVRIITCKINRIVFVHQFFETKLILCRRHVKQIVQIRPRTHRPVSIR